MGRICAICIPRGPGYRIVNLRSHNSFHIQHFTGFHKGPRRMRQNCQSSGGIDSVNYILRRKHISHRQISFFVKIRKLQIRLCSNRKDMIYRIFPSISIIPFCSGNQEHIFINSRSGWFPVVSHRNKVIAFSTINITRLFRCYFTV